MTPADVAAHDTPVWFTSEERQGSCPYDICKALRNLLPELRELRAAQVNTLYVVTDTRPLETIDHIRPFAAFLQNRLAHKGPANEVTSALIYRL